MEPEAAYAQAVDVLKSLKDDGYRYITGGDPNPGDDVARWPLRNVRVSLMVLQRYLVVNTFGVPKLRPRQILNPEPLNPKLRQNKP